MIALITLSTLLFLSIIANVLLGIAIKKGLEREEVYSNWITKYRTRIEEVYTAIKVIDDKQIFEKDDEVGVVFSEIKKTIREFDEEIK